MDAQRRGQFSVNAQPRGMQEMQPQMLPHLGYAMLALRSQALWDACRTGDLVAVKALVLDGAGDYTGHGVAFQWACEAGQLPVAQWLVDQSGIDVHANLDSAFRSACCGGHLGVAQWLVEQGGVDIHACLDNALYIACIHGHRAVALWLVGLDPCYTQWPEQCMTWLRLWSGPRSGWMRSVVRGRSPGAGAAAIEGHMAATSHNLCGKW